MKIRTKEIYNCDYCNRLYLQKKSCANHEKYCMLNPINIPKCFGCVFLKEYSEQKANYSKEIHYEPKSFYCSKLDKNLYPAKLQGKIDLGRMPREALEYIEDAEAELMPKECDLFEIDNPIIQDLLFG